MLSSLVDGIQHLVPSSDGGDDAVGICGPSERLGVIVGLGKEAVDGGLSGRPRASVGIGRVAKKPSTALSQEHEVGVKWKTNRSCRASHARTLGCLWVA